MYEDYMQNFTAYPQNLNYQNTYDFNNENYPYNYYGYMPNYSQFNRGGDTSLDFEELYPEIYKIVYPMVKKTCARVNGPITREIFENMVDEVTNNIEDINTIELNINLNNEIKSTNNVNNRGTTIKKEEENRAPRQNGLVGDLVRILLIRELLRRPGCQRPGCRPGPAMPPPYLRPPFPRYEI